MMQNRFFLVAGLLMAGGALVYWLIGHYPRIYLRIISIGVPPVGSIWRRAKQLIEDRYSWRRAMNALALISLLIGLGFFLLWGVMNM